MDTLSRSDIKDMLNAFRADIAWNISIASHNVPYINVPAGFSFLDIYPGGKTLNIRTEINNKIFIDQASSSSDFDHAMSSCMHKHWSYKMMRGNNFYTLANIAKAAKGIAHFVSTINNVQVGSCTFPFGRYRISVLDYVEYVKLNSSYQFDDVNEYDDFVQQADYLFIVNVWEFLGKDKNVLKVSRVVDFKNVDFFENELHKLLLNLFDKEL